MKPILFSTDMVKAILSGNKTQTRRVIKFPGNYNVHSYYGPEENGTYFFIWGLIVPGYMCIDGSYEIKAPWQVGDVLWVREVYLPFAGAVCPCSGYGYVCKCDKYWYRADRVLRVTEVKAERLQDILCGDMKREGCVPSTVTGGQYQQWQRDYFIPPWDSLNAKRGYGWDSNPWVWVISFERIDKPEVSE